MYNIVAAVCEEGVSEKLWRVLWKDELLSRLNSVTHQMNVVQQDRDQLSARLEQLQKVFQEAEEGTIHQAHVPV